MQFALLRFAMSIPLNVLLTLLLVLRLYGMSRDLRWTFSKEHGSVYISVATMLLESATPYAITGVVFIILYACHSNVQNLVLPILAQITVSLSTLRVQQDRQTHHRVA